MSAAWIAPAVCNPRRSRQRVTLSGRANDITANLTRRAQVVNHERTRPLRDEPPRRGSHSTMRVFEPGGEVFGY